MPALANETKYALRLLKQTPVFSAFAVLSLALGIAANVAIFSIVNGVLLKPLAFSQPGRLFTVVEIVPKIAQLYPVLPVNPRHADEWKRTVPAIESLGLAQGRHVVLAGLGQPPRVPAEAVTPDLLPTLKVQPLLGRLIQPSDAQPGRDQVALLSYSLWRSQFGADPNILGRDVRIEGVPYRVIGVLPAGFRYPLTASPFDTESEPELFTPLTLRLTGHNLEGDFNYSAIVRLKPGVERATALAMLNTAQAAIARTFPDKMELRADLVPLSDLAVRKSRLSLFLVLGAIAAVLLIVCLNLATLMLARGTLRNREIAVRTALGASRWRLTREAFMEALLLSVIGGALGSCLAKAGFKMILALAPATLPRRDEVSIDVTVLLFALAVTLVTALVSGLYPAWRQSRRDPQEALAASSRSNTGSKAGARGRSLLVSVEVALSTVLLIASGLLLASFVHLIRTNVGFEISNRVSAQITLPTAGYDKPEDAAAFYTRLLDELSRQPGIRAAAVTSHLPLSGETWIDEISRPGETAEALQKLTNVRFISGSYFETLGIPVLAGRAFAPSDKKNAAVIVGNAVARNLFPRENPVGQTLIVESEPLRILAVVADTRADIDKSAPSTIYLPYWFKAVGSQRNLKVILRSSLPERDAVAQIRRAVAKLDSGAPISHVETFSEVFSGAVSDRRFQLLLVGAFAISALLVAALGIFGIIAGVVTARRNEIGIRMALGASTRAVVRSVMEQAMLPVFTGLIAGIALTLALGSILRSLLYQVRPADPLTFAAVALLFIAVAALASWIPARRASRIDPMQALRYE